MFLPITSHLYLDYAHASVEPHLALFIAIFSGKYNVSLPWV